MNRDASAWVGAALGAATLAFVSASLEPVRAQEVAAPARDAKLSGTVHDSAGELLPGVRVVVRVVGGDAVFVSSASDATGSWEVAVPASDFYDVVAAILTTGARVELPEPEKLPAGAVHEVLLPMTMGPQPRQAGGDRLFLTFVEDPALVEHLYLEAYADYLDFEGLDSFSVRGVVAYHPREIPDVEVGLRGGADSISSDFGPDESGMSDLDAWGKLRFHRSPAGRVDLAAGALATLPTGDEDAGGRDALQSKLFVTGSYALETVVVVWHGGLRVTGDGTALGQPLDGTVSPTAGVGIAIPATPHIGVVLEGIYEGERFDDAGEDARVSTGVNWRFGSRSLFRAAASVGLNDEAPEAQLRAGVGWKF
jgi:hypothetical protein